MFLSKCQKTSYFSNHLSKINTKEIQGKQINPAKWKNRFFHENVFSRKIPHQFYERGFLRDFAYFCESLLLLETLILCNTQRTAQYTISSNFDRIKVIMQGKLFQRCAHLLYCSAQEGCHSLTWDPSFT